MAKGKAPAKPRERKNLSRNIVTAVLTEAGYRCAVPTCRGILALDLHHIWGVAAGGPDEPHNLIALCPTCHALHHRGTISQEAIYAYKAMLVALTHAFDVGAADRLLFLNNCAKDWLIVSGDGLLAFGRLIVSGLATMEMKANNDWELVTYAVNISAKGKQLIDAWREGDRARLTAALEGPPER